MTYETNAQALAGAAYDKARQQLEQLADLACRVEALERALPLPADPAKEDALETATKFFGQACFSIGVWPDRTELHVSAAADCDPKDVLDRAILALKAEQADLKNCPVHAADAFDPRDAEIATLRAALDLAEHGLMFANPAEWPEVREALAAIDALKQINPPPVQDKP